MYTLMIILFLPVDVVSVLVFLHSLHLLVHTIIISDSQDWFTALEINGKDICAIKFLTIRRPLTVFSYTFVNQIEL